MGKALEMKFSIEEIATAIDEGKATSISCIVEELDKLDKLREGKLNSQKDGKRN